MIWKNTQLDLKGTLFDLNFQFQLNKLLCEKNAFKVPDAKFELKG